MSDVANVCTTLDRLLTGNGNTALAVRDQIFAFEEQVAQLPQIELDTRHMFSEGLYIREIRIPAGVVMTGAIHKHQCAGVVSQGEMLVATEDGTMHVKAPWTYIARPGIKRAGICLVDCVWTTFHPNPSNETDIDTLEDYFFTNDPAFFHKEATP